jgi:hexosaminidase
MLSKVGKWCCLLLAALGLSFAGCKQKKFAWDTEEEYYALGFWQQRVKAYKKVKFPPQTAKLFIGDSMTEGFDLEQFFHDPTVVNMGISGDFTSGVLNRIDHVKRLQPSMVFIMIGINDILKKVPMDRLMNNYSAILRTMRIESPGTQIFVQSNLPTTAMGGSAATNAQVVAQVRMLNEFLKTQCRELNITFVDLYLDFEINGGELNPTFTYDGLHLSHKGYEVWAGRIMDFVQNGIR